MQLVHIPLMNANEDEVQVVDLRVAEGTRVAAGDVLCVVETTKAAMDIEAPIEGFVRNLAARIGARARVGSLLCAITATANEAISGSPAQEEPALNAQGIRATRKARELAAEHGIALEAIASGPKHAAGIVREEDVREFLRAHRKVESKKTPSPLPCAPGTKPLLIYGASGHAKVLIDLIRSSSPQWTIVGAVDDSSQSEEVLGVPVLGGSTEFQRLRDSGIADAALGIGSVTHHPARRALYEKLISAGFALPNLIHARAIVERSATLVEANQIFAGAVVGSAVKLATNCIINSGVVISHDCVIGSHTHLAPGCILAGGVHVGENTLIGMGVTVYFGVRIGGNVTIVNGSHVTKDVPDGAVVRPSNS